MRGETLRYTALITDLDGTAVALSSNGSDVSDDTKLAVRHALDSGRILACATGRGWALAKPVVRQLGLQHACVVEGGTRIIDPVSEKTLWQKSMSDDAAAVAFAAFRQYAPDGLLVDSRRDDFSEDETKDLAESQKIRFPAVKQVTEVPTGLRYLYLLGVTSQQASHIVNEVNGTGLAAVHTTLSWQGEHLFDVHVTDPGATKEHAIVKWRELLGLQKEQVVGFGDSGNDVPIFEAVGLRVAPISGTDELRGLADYIAPSPAEEGLLHVINRFLIPKT